MFDTDKPVSVQTFISESAIETFDEGIFNWFARTDKIKFYTILGL
jgi:hypothetical protein